MIKTGIDISYANNTYAPIDFTKLKGTIDFCIIRCGYRGYGDGTLKIDGWFKKNLNGCIVNNIPFGVYFFTQAITLKEAREEAQLCLKLVKDLQMEYPIYIDTEESGHKQNNGRADHLTPIERTACVEAFCKEIEAAGYYAGIYCSESWWNNKLIPFNLRAYDTWIANWNREPKVKYGMWQYSAKGIGEGIRGYVDMNKTAKDYPAIMKENGLNGFAAKGEVWQVTIWGLSESEYEEVCHWLQEMDFPHDDKKVREE